MKSLYAILKRDFFAFFLTPIGYIIGALFFFYYGVLYAGSRMSGSMPSIDIGSIVLRLPAILILMIPLITMRSFSEEKRNSTYEMLLSSPATLWQILLAKFFACSMLMLLLIVLTAVFPLFTVLIGGTVDLKALFSTIAFFSLSLFYIAIGIFCSALTDSQITSATLCFGVIFFLQGLLTSFANSAGLAVSKILSVILGKLAGKIDLDLIQNAVTNGLLWMDPSKRISIFNKGIIDFVPLLFYLSMAFVFLLLTARVLGWKQNSKSWHFFSGVIIAALLIGNIFLTASGEFLSFDVSRYRVYTLSEESKELLNNLDTNIRIVGFFDATGLENSNDTLILLKQYEKNANGHVTLRYANPLDMPEMLQEEGLPDTINTSTYLFAVINCETGKFRLIKESELIKTTVDAGGQTNQALDVEKTFSKAIYYVSQNELKKIYYTRGHGEEYFFSLYSELVSYIESSGFDVIALDTSLNSAIPEDADLLLMLNPSTDINETEKEAYLSYLQSGGNLFVLTEFSTETFSQLSSVLESYNIGLTDNKIKEESAQLFIGDDPYTFMSAAIGSEIIETDQIFIATYARELERLSFDTKYVINYNLIQSSNSSVAEINGNTNMTDEKTIHCIAMAALRHGKNPSKVTVITSAESFMNTPFSTLGSYSSAIQSILNDILFWMVPAEALGLENIYTKGIPSYTLFITPEKTGLAYFSAYFGVFIAPIMLIIASLMMYRKRKKM